MANGIYFDFKSLTVLTVAAVCKVNFKCTLLQALRICTGCTAHRGSRGIALLFHDRGTRRGWVVSSTSRPHFTPGKDSVPTVQEAGWATGPVWTGAEKPRPHRDSIPDCRARSSVAIPTELPSLYMFIYYILYYIYYIKIRILKTGSNEFSIIF